VISNYNSNNNSNNNIICNSINMAQSDTNYSIVSQRHIFRFVEAIDDQWAQDKLSDDEIEVPNEMVLLDDEEDEDECPLPHEEKWNDLGLDRFTNEQTTQTNTSLQQHIIPSSPRQEQT